MPVLSRICRVAKTRAAGLKRPLSLLALAAVVLGSAAFAGSPSVVLRDGGVTTVARAATTEASPANRLGTVTPAMSCGALATLDLAGKTGVPVSISTATTTTATPGGWSACQVQGNIAPQEQFEAWLPTSTWRRLYLRCGEHLGTAVHRLRAADRRPVRHGLRQRGALWDGGIRRHVRGQ